jgi:D-serine deaminase-like pyridoxal phosphate-dependent protein
MVEKARKNRVRFRPHFKTHQTLQIGKWFKNYNVGSISASSVDMAMYFSEEWKDITIAFPTNIREMKKINELAKNIDLNLLVESKETTCFLGENLRFEVKIWIKIDVGYKRTGIPWRNYSEITSLAKKLEKAENLSFAGILTHAGHAYKAKTIDEIREVYLDTLHKMKKVQKVLKLNDISNVEISVGDTPTCSVVEKFDGVDEIRPGNFLFYDITQLNLGSCLEKDIALAVACPVVAKHKDRNEITIYGGAVHLSKEAIVNKDGTKNFGYVSLPVKRGWSVKIEDTYVSSLSQEHGIVKSHNSFIEDIQIGDVLMVLPVHSCLTVDLMREFVTLRGETIQAIPKFS